MQDNFAFFFKRVLEDEGVGYEDVSGDNGGPTKCGITIADVARFNGVRCPARGAPGWDALVAKVRALDPAHAGIIYKRFYWDEVRADDLLSGLDYSVVDYAVNSGTGRAISVLRHIVGLAAGKQVDDAMLDAIRGGGDVRDIINRYQDERRAFLEHIAQIPHNAKFRRGWLDRESRVRKVALNLVGKDPVPAITASHPKAFGDHPDDAVRGVDAGAAVGAVAATVTADEPIAPTVAEGKTGLFDRLAPNASKVEELADQGSRTAQSLRSISTMFWKFWGTLLAALGLGSQAIDPAKGPAHDAGSWGSAHPFLLAFLCITVPALLITAYVYWKAHKAQKGLAAAADAKRYFPRGAPA